MDKVIMPDPQGGTDKSADVIATSLSLCQVLDPKPLLARFC